jgi:hypothetical protein
MHSSRASSGAFSFGRVPAPAAVVASADLPQHHHHRLREHAVLGDVPAGADHPAAPVRYGVSLLIDVDDLITNTTGTALGWLGALAAVKVRSMPA